MPSGIVADKVGRKKAAIAICVPYIISWLLIVFAQNVFMFYAARFLIGTYIKRLQCINKLWERKRVFVIYFREYVFLGIAIGGSCVVAPVFVSEYAETSIRGLLGTCFQLFLTIGILFVFCIGAVVTWIQLSWLCLIIPILNLVGLFFIPESPVWLMKNHDQNGAATAIKWFWGRHCNANAAIQAIQNDLEAAGSSGSIRDLFTVPGNRKGFLICVMLMFFQRK